MAETHGRKRIHAFFAITVHRHLINQKPHALTSKGQDPTVETLYDIGPSCDLDERPAQQVTADSANGYIRLLRREAQIGGL
jgi:hypothetical protein